MKLICFKIRLATIPFGPISIVTAADDSHFESSINLLKSIERHEPATEIYYFDLGLKESNLQLLIRDFPMIKVKKFEYENYPDFFDIRHEAGQYAWKPAVIRSAFDLSNRNLLWLDAGDLVVSKLTLVKKLIRRDGIFIMQTSNTVGEFTHPQTVSYFQAAEFTERLQLSAAIVGFSRKSIIARNCLNQWQELSSIREIICPENSSRLNHRQDQAVLTLVLFKEPTLDGKISKFLAAGINNLQLGLLTHQDVEVPVKN